MKIGITANPRIPGTVSALRTLLGPARGDTLIFSNRQNDPVDQVTGAFMVDNRPRAKLGDGQKARP